MTVCLYTPGLRLRLGLCLCAVKAVTRNRGGLRFLIILGLGFERLWLANLFTLSKFLQDLEVQDDQNPIESVPR